MRVFDARPGCGRPGPCPQVAPARRPRPFPSRPLGILLDVDGEHFVGLALDAIDDLLDHLRGPTANSAFAPHVFEQDAEVQFAPAGHVEDHRCCPCQDPQRHVGQQFLVQAVADLAAGDEFASVPARGEVLTMNCMDSVGSSIFRSGSGFRLFRIGTAQPEHEVSMPVIWTMSPAWPSSSSTLFRP